jgi:hypothetical protein
MLAGMTGSSLPIMPDDWLRRALLGQNCGGATPGAAALPTSTAEFLDANWRRPYRNGHFPDTAVEERDGNGAFGSKSKD